MSEVEYDWKADLTIEEDEGTTPPLFDQATNADLQDDFEIIEPKKLTDRPMLLLGIVGGGLTTMIFLLVGGFWGFSAMSGIISKEKNKDGNVSIAAVSKTSPFDESGQTSTEIDQLRQRLSQKERDAELAEFNKATVKKNVPAKTPATANTSRPTPKPPPKVQVPQVIYRDRPPTSQPQRSVAPKPQPKPVAKAPAPQVIYRDRPRPQPVAIPQAAPQPPVDPFQAWTQLTELGAFGGGDVVVSNVASDYTVQNAVYGGATSDTIPVFDPGVAATENDYVSYTDDTSVGTPIAIGTIATGKLLTPIVWAEDLDPTGEQVLIELSNHLGDGVIPRGSLIVATVQSVSQSGAIALETDGAIVNGTERTLPSGALKITSSNGGYLIGKQRRQGDPFVSDFFGAALSGIGNSAGLLNRPRQTAQIGNGGIIQQVTTNNDENLVGGLVQGFTEEMASRTRTRLESRTNTRSPLFTVNQGTKVKLMVVQSANF